MLLGEYSYRIDQKGRLAIPAKLRKEFGEGLVLTRGFDRCITVYSKSEWDRISESYSNLPTNREKNRRLIRFMSTNAFSAELDGQGRIALPSPLREYAQITDTAIIATGFKYFEIWSKKLWDEEQLLMNEQAWQLAEGMELR